MRFDEAVDAFIAHLSRVRRYSEHTTSSYKRDLGGFHQFLLEKKQEKEWLNIGPKVAKSFVAQLSRSGLAPTSIARSISACRRFWQYCFEQGWTTATPWEGISLPKKATVLPTVLYPKEMTMFLTGIATDTPEGCRLLAICELLYATGMRVSELVNLDVDHLDFDHRQIVVLGKGQKERIVFFGQSAEKAIQTYLTTVHPNPESESPLFVNTRGGRLTPRSIQRGIQSQARLQGHDDITPHTFRHSFATGLYDAGVDLRVVQELLGHESLSTTQIYTQLSKDHLKAAYYGAHPRA